MYNLAHFIVGMHMSACVQLYVSVYIVVSKGRYKWSNGPSLKDIFESVDNQNSITFIKDAHFYHQL